jgi:VIT1/CCC1 family predicted Fe2+/Mn2+ transporter
MSTAKKFTIQPIWMIVTGVIFLGLSYLPIDSSLWWLLRSLQVFGIILLIFGIILASAKLNSNRQP